MLEIKNITFAYTQRYVLDGVTFNVASGERLAVLGANGSGKTTLLRILATLAYPTSGTVEADGANIFRYSLRYRRSLGYLSETCPIMEDMRVGAYLKFCAQFKGEVQRKIRHRVSEALDNCQLTHLKNEFAGNLSFGERKRLALAEATLLRPRYLLLDDAFAGLDAAGCECVKRIFTTMPNYTAIIIAGSDRANLESVATKTFELGGE